MELVARAVKTTRPASDSNKGAESSSLSDDELVQELARYGQTADSAAGLVRFPEGRRPLERDLAKNQKQREPTSSPPSAHGHGQQIERDKLLIQVAPPPGLVGSDDSTKEDESSKKLDGRLQWFATRLELPLSNHAHNSNGAGQQWAVRKQVAPCNRNHGCRGVGGFEG